MRREGKSAYGQDHDCSLEGVRRRRGLLRAVLETLVVI